MDVEKVWNLLESTDTETLTVKGIIREKKQTHVIISNQAQFTLVALKWSPPALCENPPGTSDSPGADYVRPR